MTKHKEKILITGANGFVGSYIVRAFLKAGYSDISITKRELANTDMIDDLLDSLTVHECDINDLVALGEAVEDKDIVVHAAAIVSFDPREKEYLYKVNVEGTANIVDLCLESKVKKLIHISSIAAIGRKKNAEKISEESKWESGSMNTNYAISKHLAEQQVWRGYYEGLDMMIINPSLILGAGKWAQSSTAIFDQLYNGVPFYLPGINGVVDVRDVAEMTVQAVKLGIKGERIICSAENWSYRKIFQKISNGFGNKAPTRVLSKSLAGIAWRYYFLKALITGKKAVVTRETLKTTFSSYEYDNSKSKELLNFKYRDITKTIEHTCRTYLDAIESGKDFGILQIE